MTTLDPFDPDNYVESVPHELFTTLRRDAPLIVEGLYEIVAQVASEGVSILVVEQFARTVLGVADYAAIMLHGRITSVGQPDDIAPELEAAYMGAG